MIVVVNLKKNRIEQDYVNDLNKNVIVIPNKEDLYNLEYDNLGTNSIIDSNFKYALLGHKDYRSTLTNEIINNQIKEALKQGITVILCVNSIDMLKQDLKGITDYKNIIVAYEVDSYVGSDKTVPIERIEKFLSEVKTISKDLRVIYGGGIRLDTVNDIIKIKDLYGIIIGREYINIDKYKNLFNKEILFATGNASKVSRYKDKLLKRGITIKSLKDIDIDIEVDENGETAIDNAIIKAKAYYDATNMTTMAVDDTMYIVGVPEDKQPGVYVRRVNGKRLNDEEMIEHYTNLVKEYGKDGKLDTKWILGMAIIKDGKTYTYSETTSEYYLVDKPSEDRREGYPLSSILFNKKANKYDIYLTEEDKKIGQADDKGFIDFIDSVLYEGGK